MRKYNDDFYAWTQAQAEYLRAGAWGALDATHVAEKIEAYGMLQQQDGKILVRERLSVAYIACDSLTSPHLSPAWSFSCPLA
jgi:hypothetical protein